MKSFRVYELALAGFLLFVSAAPFWSASAAQAKPESPKPASSKKEEKRVRGRWDMADGQIKEVTCKGRAMDMTFDDYSEILRPHTDDYSKIEFSAINFTPKGKMDPCTQAKGMYARVYYYHIKGHPKEGDLISVQLRK